MKYVSHFFILYFFVLNERENCKSNCDGYYCKYDYYVRLMNARRTYTRSNTSMKRNENLTI